MTTPIRYVLPLLLVAPLTAVAAEKSFDPAARAAAIAPFVDESTKVVAYLDLNRVQVDPVMTMLRNIVPDALFDEEALRAELNEVHGALSEAGFRELYIVVSLADLPNPPWFAVAPAAEGSDLQVQTRQLTGWLEEQGGLRLQTVGRVAVIGQQRTLDRVAHTRAEPRPEVASAFEAAGDAAVQLLLLPTDDDRRVVEELIPTLPEQVGGGRSTILTHGLRWAALGIDLTGPSQIRSKPLPRPRNSEAAVGSEVGSTTQPALRLVVRSRDPQAAEALRDKWTEVVPLLKRQTEIADQTGDWQRGVWLRVVSLLTPELVGDRLVRTLDEQSDGPDALRALFAPPIEAVLYRAWRRRAMHQLLDLGLAFQSHYSAFREFPAAYTTDQNGKPLLSWRVHLLPYLGGKETKSLYDQFRLDEPWDSEHNRKLIAKMPEVYALSASKARHKGRTCYVRPIGEQTSCPGREGIAVKDIEDGTVCTFMVVEVDEEHAVIWTKPEDLAYDPSQPAKGLGGHFKRGFHAAMCDGSAHFFEFRAVGRDDPVHFFDLPGDADRLRAWFTRSAGDSVLPRD